ncbi:MAG: 6-hydroxymethylpterin diphosphokinase MptE-like protein [Candidatus Hadarchaeaceae archaeon]
MRWELWRPWYDDIVRRLGLNRRADLQAAERLNALLPQPNIQGLKNIVQGRDCIVFGAGPSLDADLKKLERAGFLKKVLIAANGATSAVINHRNPDIVVTDLDGKIEPQLAAWHRGAWLVVHGHSDNLERVEQVVPNLRERVIGTIQTRAFDKLFNFGGFTDGDRAAFMAHELGASKIYLAGMDLGQKIGRHSGDKDLERKLIKLKLCGELLAWLAGELGAKLINLTSQGEPIPNVPKEEL